MGIGAVKKELARLDKEVLIKLLAELYSKDKATREFLDFYVNPDEDALHKKCRDKISLAFFPKRGYQVRLTEGKKAIADFKKCSSNVELLADLMLFYVEQGVDYTNEYGDIDMPFYNSVASVYDHALLLIKQEHLLPTFAERAELIVHDTRGIGWGFHDDLAGSYMHTYTDG
ncbi:MAG: DUF6155 family protein [Chlorobium sp.]